MQFGCFKIRTEQNQASAEALNFSGGGFMCSGCFGMTQTLAVVHFNEAKNSIRRSLRLAFLAKVLFNFDNLRKL